MEVIRVNVQTETLNFCNALKIYFEQPKCINRQVLFSKNILNAELLSSLNVTECNMLVDTLCSKLSEAGNLKFRMRNFKLSKLNILENEDVNKLFSSNEGVYLLVRKLIPKLNNEKLEFYEFIFLDKAASKSYIFTKSFPLQKCGTYVLVNEKEQDPLAILKFKFIQLNWCFEFFEILYDESLSNKGVVWLKATFIPKFIKLSNPVFSTVNCNKLNNLQYDSKIDIVQYYKLYHKMKLKYAKYFVENWIENTDPKKFVYEDIAIATYLRILWNGGNIPGGNEKKQKFLDLGCGNGLLVHILNSEGHSGIGLDVRRRKIWDIYPNSTVLKEHTIIPTEAIYPDADWLIGNHSDELTAWIPIMTRLSSDHCQYFILPCCPYQLNGKKFQRKNTGLSSYQDFISYVKDVSKLCGFETYVDKLRIPSTKKICLIGLNKPEMSKLNYSSLVQATVAFVHKESQCIDSNEDDSGIKNKSENQLSNEVSVKVRASVESVRNCTKLPQEFINIVLRITMNELLKENVTCIVIKDGKSCTWNRGGKLLITKLASCIEAQLKKQLKNESKGLQTLLKNQHFIFEVSHGHVQFRRPESMLEICHKVLTNQNTKKWKTKKCWFFNNHPDRCPLAENVCSYSHEA